MKKLIFLSLVLAFLFILSSCHKNNDNNNDNPTPTDESIYFDASLPSGQMVFSVLPVDTSYFEYIIPLGHMNPPAHTRPTDHMYFVNTMPGTVIYALASGKVIDTFTFDEGNGQSDNRITIGVTNNASYYFMHVVLDADIKLGVHVNAGQRLGIIGESSPQYDMGAMVKTINQPFIDTVLYGPSSTHCVSPLKYFTSNLQAKLYAKVRRLGPDKDGKICYDQAGKLIGNWIEEGSPTDPYNTPNFASYLLSFVYGNYDPSKMCISIGNNSFSTFTPGNLPFDGTGEYYVQKDALKFENVTHQIGKQVYKLYRTDGYDNSMGTPMGFLIVQMVTDQKIKVECFDDTTSVNRDFTSNAKMYVR